MYFFFFDHQNDHLSSEKTTLFFQEVFQFNFFVFKTFQSINLNENSPPDVKDNHILAPQIEYSVFFTRFNNAHLLSLYKINFLTCGSDKNRIASHSL